MQHGLTSVTHSGVRSLLGNRTLSRAILAINAGGAATIKTTNAIDYCLDGIIRNKAALSAQALTVDAAQQALVTGFSAFQVQPAGKTAYYVLVLDSAGNVRCIQGSWSGMSVDPFKVPKPASLIPDIGPSYTPFGLLKVVTGSAAFTPGTTALDASNITFTFYDISVLPATAP